MNKTKGYVILGFSTLAVLYVLLLITGPHPRNYVLPKFDISAIPGIKAFTENGNESQIDPKTLVTRFETVKSAAIQKAGSFIKKRSLYDFGYQLLCISSIIASFLISLIGASKGVFVDAAHVKDNLASLKEKDQKFRKYILTLSAISILCTTVSNRLISYADKAQSTANEMIDLIKTAELKISTSINPKEINVIIDNLELDSTKY